MEPLSQKSFQLVNSDSEGAENPKHYTGCLIHAKRGLHLTDLVIAF